MTEPFVTETADLWKRYDGVEALRGLNLRVPRGSICGFLGRNGAGKTTTLKGLLGMARPTRGEARVLGLRVDEPDASLEIRRRTGFVSEDKDLYDYMSVDEIIRFTASFSPRWRADLEKRFLKDFELPPDRKVKSLSRGMRTMLALLLSTVFNDMWRPWLIVVFGAVVLSLLEQMSHELSRYGLFRVMSAESHFRGGNPPWLGLLAAAGVSVAALYAATTNITRRDF